MSDMTFPQYEHKSMDLLQLFLQRERFATYPSCQRQFIWKLGRKQKLIDTFLRRLPAPSLAYVETFHPLIGITRELVDGQQRFETICEFFSDGFPTGKRFSAEEANPLFPNLYYSQLPTDVRSQLDAYSLPITILKNVADDSIGLLFRRWQEGAPLTFAEKLYSYDGTTKEIAKRVAGHQIWTAFYNGDIIRRQPFQAGVKLLMLETNGPFANLTSPGQVHTLVKKIGWGSTPDDMVRKLDELMRLFQNADMTSISQVVTMYQGLILLEEAGFKLSKCATGCLTRWFMKIRVESLELQRNGYPIIWLKLDRVVGQREFWHEHWASFSESAESGKRDQKRFATLKDKLLLWNHQEGVCAICGKDLRFSDGLVAHHVINHASGGSTDISNLQLIHQRCHQHAMQQIPLQP